MNAEAVSAILKEGMPVSIKLGTDIAWYRNIVYKSVRDSVYVALIGQYCDRAVAPGTNISIKYVNEYFIYLFEGTVYSVNTGSPGYITMHVTNAEEIINTRLSPRYDVHAAADLKPDWDDETYPSTVIDISFGGAAFICKHGFDYNEELALDIRLPIRTMVHVKGKIVRKSIKSGMIDYSVQFTEIDENNCSLLSKYFSLLEAEISAMHEQFIKEVKGRL